MRGWPYKRAHHGCALFVSLLLFLTPLAWADTNCPDYRVDETATLRYIHDGDTLYLGDGRSIRLIGINTPELARDEQPEEPLAREARDYARSLLRPGQSVKLVYGRERKDRHGRTLAHILLPDGRVLNRLILQQGYAQAIAVPPNTHYLSCYLQDEAAARRAHLGVWGEAYHRPLQSRSLKGNEHGFHLLRGRIIRIGQGRKNIWLNLEGHVALRIDRRDLVYFGDTDFSGWKGKEVEARGWIYPSRRELRMGIRHPAALRIVGE